MVKTKTERISHFNGSLAKAKGRREKELLVGLGEFCYKESREAEMVKADERFEPWQLTSLYSRYLSTVHGSREDNVREGYLQESCLQQDFRSSVHFYPFLAMRFGLNGPEDDHLSGLSLNIWAHGVHEVSKIAHRIHGLGFCWGWTVRIPASVARLTGLETAPSPQTSSAEDEDEDDNSSTDSQASEGSAEQERQ